MEVRERQNLSDLRQPCNSLTASKELTIAKISLKVLRQQHVEFVIKGRHGLGGDVWLDIREAYRLGNSFRQLW